MSQTGGFPDWGRYVQQVSDPIIVGSQPLTAATTTFGPFFVGAYPCSLIRSSAASSGLDTSITFDYYADEAGLDFVGSSLYQVYGGNTVADAIGNLGPWLKVAVHETTFTGGDTINLNVVASMASVSDLRGQLLHQLIGLYLQSVPGSSQYDQNATPVTTGPCVWNVVTSAASWSAQLVTRTSGSVLSIIAGISSTSPAPIQPVYVALPARTVQLQFNNNDGTTQTFSSSLVQAV